MIRNWHNHFDNYSNYLPGFCGGISLDDCRDLESLTTRDAATGPPLARTA